MLDVTDARQRMSIYINHWTPRNTSCSFCSGEPCGNCGVAVCLQNRRRGYVPQDTLLLRFPYRKFSTVRTDVPSLLLSFAINAYSLYLKINTVICAHIFFLKWYLHNNTNLYPKLPIRELYFFNDIIIKRMIARVMIIGTRLP